MNIESEKDLQVWLELYKVIITYNPEVIFNDCAGAADEAFKQYKKRSKALDEKQQKDEDASWVEWRGSDVEGILWPHYEEAHVKVLYRDGNKDHGHVGDFSWAHLGANSDIVKFKFVW